MPPKDSKARGGFSRLYTDDNPFTKTGTKHCHLEPASSYAVQKNYSNEGYFGKGVLNTSWVAQFSLPPNLLPTLVTNLVGTKIVQPNFCSKPPFPNYPASNYPLSLSEQSRGATPISTRARRGGALFAALPAPLLLGLSAGCHRLLERGLGTRCPLSDSILRHSTIR